MAINDIIIRLFATALLLDCVLLLYQNYKYRNCEGDKEMAKLNCNDCIHYEVCYSVAESLHYLPNFSCNHYEEKRPKGEWINHRNDNGHNIADCSLCGKTTQWHDEDEDGIPKYCWYCGADMRTKENLNG